jgi:hypothetical protein
MIADGDARPLLRETSRHCSADAGRTAGDENILAGKIGNYETGSGHQDAFLAEVRIARFWLVVTQGEHNRSGRMALEPARRNFDANDPNARAPDHANAG